MIARGPERRWRGKDQARLAPERRDGFDRRAGKIAAPMPGAVREGFAETRPLRERRRFPETGME